MIGVTVEIRGLTEAVAALQNADAIIQSEFARAMDKSVKTISGAAKKGAPVGVSGELRASINDQVIRLAGHDVEGRVGSSMPYATYVEFGTKPHYPPLDAIMLWVQRKLGINDYAEMVRVARAIQRKIGTSGTAPNPFFQTAIDDNEDKVYQFFDQALEKIAERLARE